MRTNFTASIIPSDARAYEDRKGFARAAAGNAEVPGRVTSNGVDVMIHLDHEVIDALPVAEVRDMAWALLRELEQLGVRPLVTDGDAAYTLMLGGAILLK
jgi:hypothetical protein